MRRLVDKLMRIVLIKNFLGDGQIDYSNVDSDDEDKKCWMLCLPCRVPPLRCHSMLQLHGYPLTTFIHDKKEEEAIMIRSMILTPHQDHHQIYWQRQVVALTDGKGVSIFVFFFMFFVVFGMFLFWMFFFLWFFGMFCLWERQVVAVTEPGGKEKRVADLSNMRRLHIDYHQQKLHTQPPPPLTICRKLISIGINRKGNLLFHSS